MSVKKLSFYIDTAKITVKSDHLSLKKFLEKNTLNSKVNNWAIELESQNITFQYIPRICMKCFTCDVKCDRNYRKIVQ